MSETPLTDAVQCAEGAIGVNMMNLARRLERERAELINILMLCESKLRGVASIFNNPNFTDRYGDGPTILKVADTARVLLQRLEKEPR